MDREERPDVDRLYMTFLQATNGGGGWPMSVCLYQCLKAITHILIRAPQLKTELTPDLHPFFAGVSHCHCITVM